VVGWLGCWGLRGRSGRFGWSLWEIQERRMRTHLKCALKIAASSSTLGLFISDAFLAVAGFLFWE